MKVKTYPTTAYALEFDGVMYEHFCIINEHDGLLDLCNPSGQLVTVVATKEINNKTMPFEFDVVSKNF